MSTKVKGLPGEPGLTGKLRAVMREIPVREKGGAIATQALASLEPFLQPRAWALPTPTTAPQTTLEADLQKSII